ncbi:hypothetical protein NX059_009441 [Plenodomus lindquistii]|nr:hypothetical protein NX059_009441 [Plenodomus lindquistii]
MSPTTTELTHELQHYRTFPGYPLDALNPFFRLMNTFQEFTNTIVSALQRDDPEVVGLLDEISEIYNNLPPFFNLAAFEIWVKSAELKHPFRRTAKQHQWLHIVRAQSKTTTQCPSLTTIILDAIAVPHDAQARMLNPNHLFPDPDMLWFFRTNNNLSDVNPSDNEEQQHCAICLDPFTPTTPTPQRSTCNHTHCTSCLSTWLSHSRGTYTCPQCRACLICAQQNCTHHVITLDIAPPIPLHTILQDHWQLHLNLTGDDPDVSPEWYLATREDTRAERAQLTAVIEQLDGFRDEEGEVQVRGLGEDERGLVRWLEGEGERLLGGLWGVVEGERRRVGEVRRRVGEVRRRAVEERAVRERLELLGVLPGWVEL